MASNADLIVKLPLEARGQIASALRQRARSLIYKPSPSPRDRDMAERLREIAELIKPRGSRDG